MYINYVIIVYFQVVHKVGCKLWVPLCPHRHFCSTSTQVISGGKCPWCRGRRYCTKRLIIGDYLFGEISCHQIKTLQSLDISSVGNRQINYLPNCHIWKTARYNSHQIFLFYSMWLIYYQVLYYIILCKYVWLIYCIKGCWGWWGCIWSAIIVGLLAEDCYCQFWIYR